MKKNELVDSHCHLNRLDLTAFDGDLSAVISDAAERGVQRMVCVSIDLETLPEVLSIADQYPHVYASVGVHPSDTYQQALDVAALYEYAQHSKVVAIGETGLDYYYNESGRDIMRDHFRQHVQLAKKVDKPLIIHTRDAREDTISILQEEGAEAVGGVMHCFTESWEMAEAAMALGFYISFSGIVTFKNAKNVQAVAKKVPLERMLIETDAPYLTPVPFRGKANRPGYVAYVADYVAELKGVPLEQVARVTTQNCFDLFNFS